MMPAAPPRLSTPAGLPQRSLSRWPIARANTSVAPPGVCGTTRRTGWSGYGCAALGNAVPKNPATSARPSHRWVMGLLRRAGADVDRRGDRRRQVRALLEQRALHRLGIERARLDAGVDRERGRDAGRLAGHPALRDLAHEGVRAG